MKNDGSHKKNWKSNFIALLIAEIVAITGFSLSIPMLPLFLADDIGVSDPQSLKLWVGLIASSHAIVMAFFAPIWGNLADIFSRRTMLLRAMFGGAVVYVLMVFVQAPWQLLILRSISGCLTGTVSAATVLTVGITPVASMGFALGLLQTGVAVGHALGPLFGGVISDFLGNRAAFLITSLVLTASGFIVLKLVEDYKKPVDQQEKRKFSLLPDIKPIIHSPVIISLLFIAFSIQAANTTATPMMPLFIKELIMHGIEETSETTQYVGSTTGMVLGIGAAATAVAAVLLGKFSAKFGYLRMLIFCLGAGAILQIPQALAVNVIQLTIFRAMSSFFIGGAVPVLHTLIATSTEKKHQGTVFGFNTSIAQTGGAVGPMIGSTVALLSYQSIFLATAALLCICTCVSLWCRYVMKRSKVL